MIAQIENRLKETDLGLSKGILISVELSLLNKLFANMLLVKGCT